MSTHDNNNNNAESDVEPLEQVFIYHGVHYVITHPPQGSGPSPSVRQYEWTEGNEQRDHSSMGSTPIKEADLQCLLSGLNLPIYYNTHLLDGKDHKTEEEKNALAMKVLIDFLQCEIDTSFSVQ